MTNVANVADVAGLLRIYLHYNLSQHALQLVSWILEKAREERNSQNWTRFSEQCLPHHLFDQLFLQLQNSDSDVTELATKEILKELNTLLTS